MCLESGKMKMEQTLIFNNSKQMETTKKIKKPYLSPWVEMLELQSEVVFATSPGAAVNATWNYETEDETFTM